jgi:zinc transporter 1
MLNDVLSLCVGLWAVKMANKSSAPKMYTYGYQRAETLGALVNGVFLVALCVTIFLDAIQRFVEPQIVSNPQLVLIVGCLGLASNLVGLVLFHDHGHSHGGHSHDHGNGVKDAEEGHAHDHSDHSHTHAHEPAEEAAHNHIERTSSDSTAVKHRHSRSHSKSYVNYEDFPGPAGFRNSIIAHGRLEALESDAETSPADEDEITSSEVDPLVSASHAGYGSVPRKSIDHAEHRHSKPREGGSGGGHGHSHGDLNMKGIFLHVMGDALGNIGVIATALIIWLTKFPGRYYFDPAISLVITIIILCSAIPLCKAASRILLQAVPNGIEVDDIRDDIQDLPGIESCHHLHVWQLSDTKLVASLHVRVNFNFRGEGSQRYMQLASAIRQCLHEYGIHSSTIQPEFHHGSEYEGDVGHRNAPLPGAGGDELDCLLDCGDGCGDGGKSCCPPPPRSEAGSTNGHEGHRH